MHFYNDGNNILFKEEISDLYHHHTHITDPQDNWLSTKSKYTTNSIPFELHTGAAQDKQNGFCAPC